MNVRNAKLLLLSVFAARGSSFLFSKTLMVHMEPMSVLAVRFLLSFAVLSALFFPKLKTCSRAGLRCGTLLGLLYSVMLVFEMFGLMFIDSGTSALVENLAIVLVPLYFAIVTKTPPMRKTILSVILAISGVAFLSLTQIGSRSGIFGIVLTLCAALSYSGCIIVTEKVSSKADPVTIGIIQIGTMGLFSFFLALTTKTFSLPADPTEWTLMALLVLLCSCFGFTFQPLGQKYVSAETAAVFTVINPLTASLLGILVAGEPLSLYKLIGCMLVLSALLLYNLRDRYIS